MGFCKGFCGIVFGKGVYPFLQGCATGGAGFIFCSCTLTGYFLKAGVCCMLYVLEKARVFLLFASLLRGTLLDPLCDSTSGTRCRPPKQKAPIRFSPPLAGRGFSVLFFSRFSAICRICGISRVFADVGNILFSLANVLFYTRYRCFCSRFRGFIPFRGQFCFAQILTDCKQKGENRAKMSPNVRVCPQMSAFVRFCPRLTHVKDVL